MFVHPRPIVDQRSADSAGPACALDVLSGYDARVSGCSVSAQIVRRHLAGMGARVSSAESGTPLGAAAVVRVSRRAGRPDERPLTVSVGWDGGLGAGLVDEGTIQAACGLMQVHGRREGRARRLGIDYASIVAGVLAVQAVLAGLLARERGLGVTEAQTSVADAALLVVSQYLADATVQLDEDTAEPVKGMPTPLKSLEGVAFELETLDGDVWVSFWRALGLTGAPVGRGWRSFVFRYVTAECALPVELHAAARSFPIGAIKAAATASGACVCALRTHAERITELGLDDGASVGPVWKLTGLASAGDGLPAAGVGSALPLDGLRVIEAGRRVQAPFASHLLQALGAHVTRIESPGGDALRWMGGMARGTSARFRALNDGKEIVEFDIKDPLQREQLLGLGAEADVFLHNWAPGKAAQLGLNVADFAARNPAIVYAHASGWGDAVTDGSLLGTDFIVQAYSGLAETLTPAGEDPAPSLMTLLDLMGGLVAVEGILAGLLRRQQDRRGQRVDTSLLAAASVLQAEVLEAAARGSERGRIGGRPRWAPLDRPLRTADGLLWITSDGREPVERLAAACGLADHRAPVAEDRIMRHLLTASARELQPQLEAAGFACAVVCEDLAEIAADTAFAPALRFDGCAFVRAPWRWS